MKTPKFLIGVLFMVALGFNSFGQNQKYKMVGSNSAKIEINKTITSTEEILPFEKNQTKVYGVAVSGKITLNNQEAVVKFILLDKNFNEYLVYETYSLLETSNPILLDEICEETAVLNGIKMHALRIEVENAEVQLSSISFTSKLESGLNIEKTKKEKKQTQNLDKINRLNKNLKERGHHWVAGITEISELSYGEKKKLYGQSSFPPGFEYYSGGIISTGSTSLKSASVSMMVGDWDWRNRHGINWITPVTNQGSCGSCWSFAATGAAEALANLYFNQQLNLDLSEQDILSCSGGGSCTGGYPGVALDYIANTGVVDEGAFPYAEADLFCDDKSNSLTSLIKIGGRIDFGSAAYPKTEDVLKKMIIDNGPLSGGLSDWSHAMVLVGYKVVEEGDVFYYRDLNLSRYPKTVSAGDPLIGKTVWIFKNSWGPYFGDAGYVYVETPISNINWTHALKTPVVSVINSIDVVCQDIDGDGYFWWGLGEKPASCSGPDQPDGDDSNPALGPLDEYGNCISLLAPPVADFIADRNVISVGEEVTFTDKSANNPVSWLWEFEGGEPATSNLKNPKVKYNIPNSYRVKLTVQSQFGSDTKIIENYIQVEEIISEYCIPVANSVDEWIAGVQIGETKQTSGAGSYEDFTSTVFEINAGAANNITLIPGYAKRKSAEYWVVWIDYNGDTDFSDVGEKVLSVSRKRGTISEIINIPADLNIVTRMRIAMGSNEPSECGTIASGEVEDYTVRISQSEPEIIYTDYCQPEGINSSSDFIKNVTIENVLNNNSGGSGYMFYQEPLYLNAKQNYLVTLNPVIYKNRNFWRIWIDFNNDGDFDDGDETVLAVDGNRGNVTSAIGFPDYASGETRMRIAMKTGKAPSPCENFYNGEVEDYVVFFEETPAALKSGIVNEPQVNKTEIFQYYPNPVVDKLKITLSAPGLNDSYEIYNMTGQIIIDNKINTNEIEIDCMNYSPGIYLIVVNNNGTVYKEKFVKK